MRVSEIRVNQIRVNQGLGVHCDETKSESWPVQVLVSVLPEQS